MTLRWSFVIKLAKNQHVRTKYPKSRSLTSKFCYLSWFQILLEREGSALVPYSKQVDQMALRRDLEVRLFTFKNVQTFALFRNNHFALWISVRWRFYITKEKKNWPVLHLRHDDLWECWSLHATKFSQYTFTKPDFSWDLDNKRARRYTFSMIDQKTQGYWMRHRRWWSSPV